jgi:acetolactate synthase-1/3 small subunit
MIQIISLLVENRPGALARITGVLSARGFNIESLTVAPTEDAALSRMTIVVDVADNQRVQVVKQLNKIVNVVQATDLSEAPLVRRELALIKVQVDSANRQALLKEAEIFRARVVDASPTAYTLEVTGDTEKLEAFIELLRSYGKLEVVRSGALALARTPKARAADTPDLAKEQEMATTN